MKLLRWFLLTCFLAIGLHIAFVWYAPALGTRLGISMMVSTLAKSESMLFAGIPYSTTPCLRQLALALQDLEVPILSIHSPFVMFPRDRFVSTVSFPRKSHTGRYLFTI